MVDIYTGDDAQANLGFLIAQTTHIETNINEVKFAEVQYPELIPVDTSANEYAKSVTYFSSEDFGKAEWVNGNSSDVPMAGTERQKFETQVHTAGIGYGYGMEEVAQARMLGQNLEADGARAARRSYEYMVEDVALNGDASKGFEGFVNHSQIPTVNAVAGGWSATTPPNEILNDINVSIVGQASATNFVAFSDTVILPYDALSLIASMQNGDGNDTTVLEFVKRNNLYTAKTGRPLMIRAMRELSTAGAGGTQRMITYRRDPDVLKLHIPMPHRFMTPRQVNSFRYEVDGVFRLGGLDVRRPSEIRYTDGI